MVGSAFSPATRHKKYDAVDQNPNDFRPNTFKVVTSEREIFELLELPYVGLFISSPTMLIHVKLTIFERQLSPTERDFRNWGPKYLREGERPVTVITYMPGPVLTRVLQ